ncbi:hypothetical protein DL89DRAFT_263876 [Linderina pennispora]|uniref:ABC transporter domain-containing protein n=1 Tax=Linderina pennispora TaxID=61395 RepID=A0A1Y1WK43_9FUNG|nr:uncharacterized protein DL89DRAFT_263876 [Linderina pennispora]ORX73852.1 hypothetical protein DL89DRAFT_263876 [Linderina pennispora]
MLPQDQTPVPSAVTALSAIAPNNRPPTTEYTRLNNDDASEMPEKPNASRQYTFGLVFLRRLYHLFRVMLSKQSPERIGLCCVGLVIGKLLAEVVFYFSGSLPSHFYKVLGDKDQKAFYPLLLECIGIVVLSGTAKASLLFVNGILGVMMRNALTQFTHEQYVKAQSFYALVSQGQIDNPDQRISQDIEKLSANLAEVLSELLIAPFLVLYYTYKCFAISGVFGPLSVYLYFILGALNVYVQEKEEGNFRFQQVRIREFAESIAFYGGEETEREIADKALLQVVGAQRRLVRSQFWVNFVTQLFSYLGATVSYIIIAIPIFLGAYGDKSGTELSSIISMNAFVSLYLIYRFTLVIEQAKKLTDVAGFTARIVQMWEELDSIASNEGGICAAQGDAQSGIQAVGLDVTTPKGLPLVANLSVAVAPRDSLVITGANGVGKTSVLRTLCGLWPPSAGTITLPYTNNALDVFFLPQTPYIVAGSLREQLTYPGAWGNSLRVCSDQDLANLLELVGLAHLRLLPHDEPHSVQFWLGTLSPGEQQRVSIARVLFWRPRFAVLDECTSSLDPGAEASLYQAMVDLDITLVSVSHREGLYRFHRRRLDLTRDGYTITDI